VAKGRHQLRHLRILTEADVFHTGDTWWNGHFPFIDYSTGGSINSMIRAAESNLATVTDKTIIIPGHGPVGNKSQFVEYRDLLVTIRDKIAALKKQGKSSDEIVVAKPTRPTMQRGAGSLSRAISLPDWFTPVCDTTKSVLKPDTFGEGA